MFLLIIYQLHVFLLRQKSWDLQSLVHEKESKNLEKYVLKN